MSISSLNSNLLAQNSNSNLSINTTPSLQNLGSALSAGDLVGAKSIFSALNSNSSSTSPLSGANGPTSAASNTLMGQLGNALHSANLNQAQQITSALQTLSSNAVTSNPLFSDSNSQTTSSGFNDSLFNALSLTGVGSGSASSLAGIASPAASGMVSPQQVIAQNMDTFLNNLLATLKAQNPSATSSSGTSSASSAKQNPYAAGSSTNQFSAGLQSLIQQIAKSPNALNELNTSGSNAVNTSASTTVPTASTSPQPSASDSSQSAQVSQLQKSYNDLLSSQGSNVGSSSSLINFLENFESNMKTMQSSGGFLNVNA